MAESRWLTVYLVGAGVGTAEGAGLGPPPGGAGLLEDGWAVGAGEPAIGQKVPISVGHSTYPSATASCSPPELQVTVVVGSVPTVMDNTPSLVHVC